MAPTQHLLLLTMEECAEVAHRCSKGARFGLDEVQPEQTLTNAQRLSAELTDLHTVILMLAEEAGLPIGAHPDDVQAKRAKVEKYMKLSRERGQLLDGTLGPRAQLAADRQLATWLYLYHQADFERDQHYWVVVCHQELADSGLPLSDEKRATLLAVRDDVLSKEAAPSVRERDHGIPAYPHQKPLPPGYSPWGVEKDDS